ncbi:solute carrier family 25 member 45-like [Adelges cooleyi]|uniref:solute carrier family 25 member 45-like n=1 Tax=Adelges cooleyi TaxID=133065 RepID=UPI00217FBDD7|nr:solute carrier family 25 member 45-like [Adelges cooleyi]
MMFPVLSSGVVNSVVFGVNGNTMRYIQTHFRDNVSENDRLVRVCCNSESLHKYWHLDYFVSGCVAGFFSTLINIPVELVKTMLQASNISTRPTVSSEIGPIQLTRILYRQNGIRSLYSGGIVLLLRDVPATGIYMLSYEHICCLLRYQTEEQRKPDDSFSWSIQVFAGGMAGVTSWAMILPLDVIKTKMMTDSGNSLYNGIWDCIRTTYKSGGIMQFYQGFWVTCLRAFPVNSVAFLVYEFLLKTCSDPVNESTDIKTKQSKWLE